MSRSLCRHFIPGALSLCAAGLILSMSFSAGVDPPSELRVGGLFFEPLGNAILLGEDTDGSGALDLLTITVPNTPDGDPSIPNGARLVLSTAPPETPPHGLLITGWKSRFGFAAESGGADGGVADGEGEAGVTIGPHGPWPQLYFEKTFTECAGTTVTVKGDLSNSPLDVRVRGSLDDETVVEAETTVRRPPSVPIGCMQTPIGLPSEGGGVDLHLIWHLKEDADGAPKFVMVQEICFPEPVLFEPDTWINLRPELVLVDKLRIEVELVDADVPVPPAFLFSFHSTSSQPTAGMTELSGGNLSSSSTLGTRSHVVKAVGQSHITGVEVCEESPDPTEPPTCKHAIELSNLGGGEGGADSGGDGVLVSPNREEPLPGYPFILLPFTPQPGSTLRLKTEVCLDGSTSGDSIPDCGTSDLRYAIALQSLGASVIAGIDEKLLSGLGAFYPIAVTVAGSYRLTGNLYVEIQPGPDRLPPRIVSVGHHNHCDGEHMMCTSVKFASDVTFMLPEGESVVGHEVRFVSAQPMIVDHVRGLNLTLSASPGSPPQKLILTDIGPADVQFTEGYVFGFHHQAFGPLGISVNDEGVKLTATGGSTGGGDPVEGSLTVDAGDAAEWITFRDFVVEGTVHVEPFPGFDKTLIRMLLSSCDDDPECVPIPEAPRVVRIEFLRENANGDPGGDDFTIRWQHCFLDGYSLSPLDADCDDAPCVETIEICVGHSNDFLGSIRMGAVPLTTTCGEGGGSGGLASDGGGELFFDLIFHEPVLISDCAGSEPFEFTGIVRVTTAGFPVPIGDVLIRPRFHIPQVGDEVLVSIGGESVGLFGLDHTASGAARLSADSSLNVAGESNEGPVLVLRNPANDQPAILRTTLFGSEVIAVLDTGIDYSLPPELPMPTPSLHHGWDFSSETHMRDDEGHGTHVASTVESRSGAGEHSVAPGLSNLSDTAPTVEVLAGDTVIASFPNHADEIVAWREGSDSAWSDGNNYLLLPGNGSGSIVQATLRWNEPLNFTFTSPLAEEITHEGDRLRFTFETDLDLVGIVAHELTTINIPEVIITDMTFGDKPQPTPCPADITGDTIVDIFDLLAVLACWGPVPPGSTCAEADVTNDNVVDIFDLLFILANWGPCA